MRLLLALLLLAGGLGPSPATQGAYRPTRLELKAQGFLLGVRLDGALGGALDPSDGLSAHRWARHMANEGGVSHSGCACAEIVGYGPTLRAVFSAWLDSPKHRSILLGDWHRFGVGAVRDGAVYAVLQFR